MKSRSRSNRKLSFVQFFLRHWGPQPCNHTDLVQVHQESTFRIMHIQNILPEPVLRRVLSALQRENTRKKGAWTPSVVGDNVLDTEIRHSRSIDFLPMVSRPHKAREILDRVGYQELEQIILQRLGITLDSSPGCLVEIKALWYPPHGFYKAHHDQGDMGPGGQLRDYSTKENAMKRLWTGVLYLNDVEEGGELVFPHTHYGSNGPVVISPQQNSLILFNNYYADSDGCIRRTTMEPLSIHEAKCPRTQDKYALNIWFSTCFSYRSLAAECRSAMKLTPTCRKGSRVSPPRAPI